MPRQDPSFTDADLIRLFCKNLDPAEKRRVIERFRGYIVSRKKLCDEDAEIKTDFCRWSKVFHELTDKCETAGKLLPPVLAALGALEAALAALSWAGWVGRLIVVLRVAVAYLIAIVTFFGAIIIMVGEMNSYAGSLVLFFCEHLDAEVEGEPPNPEGLPKSPDEKLNDFIKEIEDWLNSIFSSDTTTPPDAWPPENIPDDFPTYV